MEYLNSKLKFKHLKLWHSSKMFTFSLESVLIAHFPKIKRKAYLLDIGTNNAIIPLIIAQKYSNQIDAIEINEAAAKIAEKNVQLNHKKDQIKIITGDFNHFKPPKKYTLIICNPPFFAINSKSYPLTKENDAIKNARHEFNLKLEDLIGNAKKMIENKGYFILTHRVERLETVLKLLRKNDFSPHRLQFIHPYKDKPAQTFLIESRFKSNSFVRIEPPIITHNKDHSFTKEVKVMYGEEF